MHRTQKLNTLTGGLCLLVSIALHLLLFRSSCWSTLSTPTQIELQAGHSAVELTLLPSIASKTAKPDPEPPPATQPVEEPPSAPIIEKPAELSRPEPKEELPPEIEPESQTEPMPKPEHPHVESIEQDADLKPKGVETTAKAARSFHPLYPRTSRRRNEEGTVVITLSVLTDGSANNILVSQSSGYPLLDKAALRSVRKSRYKPATNNGNPVDSTLEQTYVFRLADQ